MGLSFSGQQLLVLGPTLNFLISKVSHRSCPLGPGEKLGSERVVESWNMNLVSRVHWGLSSLKERQKEIGGLGREAQACVFSAVGSQSPGDKFPSQILGPSSHGPNPTSSTFTCSHSHPVSLWVPTLGTPGPLHICGTFMLQRGMRCPGFGLLPLASHLCSLWNTNPDPWPSPSHSLFLRLTSLSSRPTILHPHHLSLSLCLLPCPPLPPQLPMSGPPPSPTPWAPSPPDSPWSLLLLPAGLAPAWTKGSFVG